MAEYASIFNDVLGPVMVGPSSSHTAASVRIGKALRQMVKGNVTYFQADFAPKGSLAASYITQCSDVGLVGGLLGMEPTHEDLLRSIELAEAGGMTINFRIIPYEAEHPNTYRMIIRSDQMEEVTATALSVGGGMIVFTEIQGEPVTISGGFYETLIYGKSPTSAISDVTAYAEAKVPGFCQIEQRVADEKVFLNIKSHQPITEEVLAGFKQFFQIDEVIAFDPVLPVMSQKEKNVPFKTAEEMLQIAERDQLELWQLATMYESVRGNISEQQVYDKMADIVAIMGKGIEIGLKGTEYADRILGYQSYKVGEHQAQMIGGTLTADIVAFITAMMEVKSSMNVFVAAPTAGSCGALPGTVFAVAKEYNKSNDEIIKAMLAAGIIGVFIAEYATFAAEVAGCQAECGAGSGMTAAALVQLMGGSARTAANAASMALQNIFGMVCDPVDVRVEVPCLGKNMMCGMNALGAANMAIAGFDVVIPLDETIDSFDKVGRMIPPELRCTGLAGLAQTKTGLEISRQLACRKGCC
ncbi:L-serine ammonia-lyase, iron-sulfur-dependent, subunit alpha [Enterococcus sp. AZ163]|uniref:L-serine ammonia-lyase, iron-sulfur-dependent, subunit alpha n=1 Tax=Enterococcus sp. AZ163 TaxID=2774638 RepID=UPI003D2D9774